MPLPKNLDRCEPTAALTPVCVLAEDVRKAWSAVTKTLFILPDGRCILCRKTDTEDVYDYEMDIGAGFSAAVCNRWDIPSDVPMLLSNTQYTISCMTANPHILTICLEHGSETLYASLCATNEPTAPQIRTKDHVISLTAWSQTERRFKEMTIDAKNINLSSLLDMRPATERKAKKQAPVQPPVEEVTQVAEPEAEEIVADTMPEAATEEPSEVQEPAAPVADTAPTATPKRTRTRKQAVPGLKIDWEQVLQYLQQPVTAELTADMAQQELRVIRDVQIAAARRAANVALAVVDRTVELEASMSELAAVRDALSKLKI